MASGHSWRGQVPNEEVTYRERNVQDVIIEDLQRQVAELTWRLEQIMEGDRDMEDHGLESSTLENLYHNFALGQDKRGRQDRYGDLGLKVDIPEFSGNV